MGHVGAGMKLQLQQGSPLDGLRLHMLDARDVEEMVFVVIRQVAFHLRRVHAPVGLGDIDCRNAQRGEDVAGHLLQRQPRPQHDGKNQHDNRYRATQ